MQSSSSDQDLANVYQQKTDKQHILDNPDTYIGSVENVDASMWIYDNETKKIALKNIEYIPGLYKLFDEGIVNCRDHVIRMIQSSNIHKKFVSYIDTQVSEDGTITMTNDGNGIDIAKHPEYDIWIPEMIFGHLRTSTNYNKNEKRIVGGKNGFGFKLVLIWSTYGKIETVDHIRGLKYVQEFHDNLDKMGEPKITKVKSSTPYTKVIFKPDYKRFGIEGITSDMFNLLKKRIYDIAASTDHSIKKVKITYNNELIPVKTFQHYVDMYIGSKGESKRIYEKTDERWEYAVALSPIHEFVQVSFVNGICTFKGGKHVDYISNQIVRKLCDYIEKKKKVKVNAASIREQIMLFLRCDIENPSFDSQTKDYMNTPAAKFGSSCSVSDGFVEKIAKMGVMEVACNLTEAKENKLVKKTDGSKTKTIRGINSFIDANFAGTNQSKDCILILCEGLSALSGIVSGLSSDDRNIIGIYPLRGKLLNVRGEQMKKIAENKEINDIKKILGLESGKEYTNIEEVNKYLRYGKIMYMTDQDLDGSHIKGLCINMFHSEWGTLTKIPGFISFMNTPILRAKKGSQTQLFYNDGEYNTWKEGFGEQGPSGWSIKYFKGLGTSTSAEFKDYFANKKIVNFVHTNSSDDMIDRIFNKKRTDDRKRWLENYNKDAYLNTSHKDVNYEDFINQELIHFSTYDCARSIPNMVDGLKISLRKILYSAFKRKLTSEIKVAQFSGYVSEHSAYHHGEASLNGAIVNMAQNFVGSNNINLLMPNGQFGTRIMGGSDSASPRYIHTELNPIVDIIYPKDDMPLLNYTNDDGLLVEPEYYVPIIPMVLINGMVGIGTGFSTNIPCFNPYKIINNIIQKLNNSKLYPMEPYYNNFTGNIIRKDKFNYITKGKYNVDNPENKITITELPIGKWTDDYIKFIQDNIIGLKENKKNCFITDYENHSTDTSVNIIIKVTDEFMYDYEHSTPDSDGITFIEKHLKLTSNKSLNNIHLYNSSNQIQKYTISEIIDEHFDTRYNLYVKRKDYLLNILKNKITILESKIRFIYDIIDENITIYKKSKKDIIQQLYSKEYILLNDNTITLSKDKSIDNINTDYDYLIKMPIYSLSQEKIDEFNTELNKHKEEYNILENKTIKDIWIDELNKLKLSLERYVI